jgi:hypothetical protein
MTDAERQRLTELDNKISWNNPTDKGEPLTEEERKEHKELFAKLWKEGQPNKLAVLYQGKLEEYRIENSLLDDEIKSILQEPEVTFAAVNGEIIKGKEGDFLQCRLSQ